MPNRTKCILLVSVIGYMVLAHPSFVRCRAGAWLGAQVYRCLGPCLMTNDRTLISVVSAQVYLFLGRVWCSVCPFMIYGELVQRWRLSTGAALRPWPREQGKTPPPFSLHRQAPAHHAPPAVMLHQLSCMLCCTQQTARIR
jgi:4Fe-4S binding domain